MRKLHLNLAPPYLKYPSLQTMTKYANPSSPVLLSLPQPPVYLYTMMGIWASVTGIMGITANTLAIGVFIKVKRVRRL